MAQPAVNQPSWGYGYPTNQIPVGNMNYQTTSTGMPYTGIPNPRNTFTPWGKPNWSYMPVMGGIPIHTAGGVKGPPYGGPPPRGPSVPPYGGPRSPNGPPPGDPGGSFGPGGFGGPPPSGPRGPGGPPPNGHNGPGGPNPRDQSLRSTSSHQTFQQSVYQ